MKTTSKSGYGRWMRAPVLGLLTGLALAAFPGNAAIGPSQPAESQNPSGLGDLLRQARQEMSQGRPNVAVIYLKKAAALAPKNTDVRIQLGAAYLRSGDANSAVRELRTARQTGATDERVLPVLYDAMLARNDGAQLLDQFPAPKPGDRSKLAAATLRARGIALMQSKHPDEAAQSLDQALAIDRDPSALVVRARLAKDQNDLPGALKLADEAYAKAPRDQNVLLLRVSLLQAANKPEQALPAADNLVKASPGSPVALLARTGVYLQMKQDAKARTDIDAVLAKWKNLPQALYFKAMLLERAKDPKGAWAVAQSLPPEFVNSRPEVAMMVARMAAIGGHKDIAVNILSGLISRTPDIVEPRVLLASQYLRDQNGQRALDILQPLRDTQDPRIMVLFAQAYAQLKQYSKSTEYMERANSAGFGGDLLKRQLAVTNLQQGDYDNAIKQLREIFTKQSSDQVAAGMLITALVRSGDIAGASAVADKFAAAAPKSPYGPLYQGQIQIARQNFDGAIKAFDRAVAMDPKFVLGYYDRAIARAGRNDFQSAGADLDTILSIDPKNVMAMVRAADFAFRQKQDQKAQGFLQRAVAVDAKNPTSNMALISFYISRNRLKEAANAANAFLKVAPNDANAQMMQAEIQLAMNQPDPALATFRRLTTKYPDSSQLQLMLASALLAKKDGNGALTAYKRAVQLSPKFTLARQTLARYAMATNNAALALSVATEGTKVDPGAPSDQLLASVLAGQKKLDQAAAVLKQSIAKYPDEGSTIFYSQLLRQTGKAKQADGMLNEWIAKHPNAIAARLELGQAQMQSRPDAAEQQFRAVLKVQPKNLVALNNLSWLLQKKDPRQAVAYAEQAAQLAPNSAAVLDTLGWVKWLAKDAKGSLPVLQKAHAADPNNAEISYHLAVALEGTGQRAEAKKTLAPVLASNQEFSEKKDAEALGARLR